MAKKTESFGTVRSPKGVAGYNYLVEADTKWNKNPNDPGKHRTQLFILDNKDAEFLAFAKKLIEAETKFLGKASGKVPCLKQADANLASKFSEYGVKPGTLYFEFKTNAQKNDAGEVIPVTIVGPDTKPTDQKVWGGDLIRVSTTIAGYISGKNKGITLYLNAVQLIEKRNNGGVDRLSVFTNETTEGAPFQAETTEQAPAKAKATKKAQPTTDVNAEAAIANVGNDDNEEAASGDADGVNLADLV